jgi:hypothetical protein
METTQPESLLAINPDESHIKTTNLFNNISKGFKNDFANGNIGNLCFAASILQVFAAEILIKKEEKKKKRSNNN